MKHLHLILATITKANVVETGDDGFTCHLFTQGVTLSIIFSWDGGWEHASIHTDKKRVPTWEEMCLAKNTFWRPDEDVMQLHPSIDRYVNVHNYTLHLWRPIHETIPLPPLILV